MPWLPVAPNVAPQADAIKVSGFTLMQSPAPSPTDVPAAEDLSEWQWEQYQLEMDAAASLGIAVAGVHADWKSRVLVAEFSRSSTVEESGKRVRYGVVARLIVRVSNFASDANMTLPFIAAEAQFNRLEASASLRVEGFVGPSVGSQFPNFGSFDVESYVKLMDALTSLKNTISKEVQHIRPSQLWVWGESTSADGSVDQRLTEAVGTTP